MTFSKFEKYAAGKINNHVSEVDAEALWADILPHVQKSNNRRGGLIWFFFFALIASLVAFYTLSDNGNPDSESEITSLSTIDLMNKSNGSESSFSSFKKESVVPSTPETESEKSTKQNAQFTNTKNTQNQLIDKHAQVNNQQKKYKATITNQPQIMESAAAESGLIPNLSEPLIILEDEEIAPIIGLKEENTNFEELTIIENNEAIPMDSEQSGITVESVALAVVMDSAEESIAVADDKKDETPLPPRNKFKIKYGFGLYGGYGSSFYSLKAKDEMSADYLKLRLQSEEQLETIQMGFEAIAQSEVGVYFKTGLQYSRNARKFSLNSSIVSIDSVHGIQRIFVNNNTMDTIYVYGQVPVTTTTTYNKTTYNYFHLMDVPLLLGYTYKNENWSFGVEAGALINISTKTKGEIRGFEDDIYNIKDDQLKWYKDNIGVSFTASVIAAYHLNDNLQIYLAPTARLESVFSTDSNPIEQKHGSLGVNIGVRYFIGY